MCPSVPSSLPLISLTGFLANLDPYPSLLNLDSPAPDISKVSPYSVLSPFALAFDSSTSELNDYEIGILNTLLPLFTTA
ncbi:hypothetical protein VN97_g6904 [Penicillium thymicola]|uniref:Uncharacterized protein n=1 Tax=Penicillium thymicola TaxID=293382 RepID=A0AAI9TFS6_PENTH|nr:hypothetical protein VN97_g6904 [Penicillium thymicola]